MRTNGGWSPRVALRPKRWCRSRSWPTDRRPVRLVGGPTRALVGHHAQPHVRRRKFGTLKSRSQMRPVGPGASPEGIAGARVHLCVYPASGQQSARPLRSACRATGRAKRPAPARSSLTATSVIQAAVPARSIVICLPRIATASRRRRGRPPFVASVSSSASAGVVPSPVAVAPPAAEASSSA